MSDTENIVRDIFGESDESDEEFEVSFFCLFVRLCNYWINVGF